MSTKSTRTQQAYRTVTFRVSNIKSVAKKPKGGKVRKARIKF